MAERVFRPDDAGFRAMAIGPEIRAAVTAIAEKAKADAEALAQDFRVTGEYAGAFEVTSETIRWHTEVDEHDVAAGVLTNTSDHAAAVEWGNSHSHRPHRVLGRVLDGLDHG